MVKGGGRFQVGARLQAAMGRGGVAGEGWRRRSLLALLALLLAGGALAAALGGGSSLVVLPGIQPGAAGAESLGAGPVADRDASRAAAGAGAQDIPGLSERLAALGMPAALAGIGPEPRRALQDLAGPGFEPLPLPEPAAHEPLLAALAAYTSALGLPSVPVLDAQAALAQVDLGPEGQRALAQLLLAYTEAVSLRREATAGLTPQERALLALDEPTVADWLAENPARGWGGFEEEALRIVAQKVDATRTLQAADLLVRAVEATRATLASDNRPEMGLPGSSAVPPGAPGQPLAVTGAAGPSPPSFGDAWRDLHVQLGASPPGAVPELHPTLQSALAPLLAAKVQGLRTDDALEEATLAYEAAQGALPTLEAWSALLRLGARGPPQAPAAPSSTPLGPSPAAAPNLDPFRRALDSALQGLGPDARAALLEGASVHDLLRRDGWSPQEALLVRDWARAHEALPGAQLAALQHSAAPLAVLPDADGDGCPDAIRAAAPFSCALARLAVAEGAPLPAPVPRMEPQPSSSPVPAPGLLFDDALLGTQSTLCEAPQGTCVGPMSLLRIGGTDAQTYTWPAVIQVDLGGNDRHETEVAGPAFARVRGACADGGAAGQACVPPPCPAGSSCTNTTGSYAIDIEGDDTYATPQRNLTQGAAFGRGASLLLDLAGNDLYQASQNAQGFGGTGIGLLVDAAGDDRYEAGASSQGAAAGAVSTNLAGVATVNGVPVPSWGSLADLAGDDRYSFSQQGSLLDTYGVAVLLDANGTDTYTSLQPIDPELLATNPTLAFLTQGRFVGTQPGMAAGLALFADRGLERDAYRTLDLEGGLADISAAKNQQMMRANGANSGPDVPGYGFFHDGDPVDPDDRRDHDGDGVPTAAENALGTDPQDGASNPGNLFYVLTGGTLGEPGATGLAGLDRQGPWLATPTQLQAPTVGSVALPGIVIGGRGDDTHPAWVPFLVDLGGDDAYTAPYAGGASPLATGLFASQHQAGDLPPTDVTLLLDVGATADGEDRYAPDPASCTRIRNGPNSHASAAGDASIRSAGIHVFPAACPALGGAHNGIAILADDGGRNAFRSTLSIDVNANTPVGATGPSVANIAGYGVMQGASLFDGVGMLLTWNAANEFEATVRVRAAESGSTAFGPFAPSAQALGLAQGAALGGVALLASMGPGSDVYEVDVTAEALQGSGVDAAIVRGASQGAGLSGVGVLLDEGGSDSWRSPAGFSQGFAAGSAQPSNTVAGGSPAALSRLSLASIPGPNSGLGTASRPTLGLLWAGAGDDELHAGAASQGAAGGYVGSAVAVLGNFEPSAGGSGGLGMLVDSSGNDVYRLQPIAGQPGLGQGAGVRHGAGVLLELDGDDLYDAANATHVQGAAVRGIGILDDRGGHDRYLALERSQGYGEHDGLRVTRNSFGTTSPQGGTAFAANAWDLSDPGPSLGLLRDASGWDAYSARSLAQGAADLVRHDLANIDSCAASVPTNGIVVSACDRLGQHCAAWGTPEPTTTGLGVPFTAPSVDSDLCQAPGNCQPAATGPCEDVPNRRQCLMAAGAQPCVDTSTGVGCVALCPGSVLGLLLDGAGDDVYEYPGAKCGVQPDGSCAPGPTGGNGWKWTQPTEFPVVLGVGADDESLDGALAAALGLLPQPARDRLPVRVAVGLAPDAAGAQMLPVGVPVSGTVYLVADVRVDAPLGPEDVKRVDFLVDGRLAGQAASVPGSPGRYVLEWVTRVPQDTGASQRVPDGLHTVVASAFVAQDAARQRSGRPALSMPTTSVESDARPVEVDNPPLLSLELDGPIVAPDVDRRVRLDLALAPDARGADQAVRLTVVRESDGQSWVLDERGRQPGPFSWLLEGDECGGACADGRHVVVAHAQDGRGQAAAVLASVVYDRLAPTSAVTLPAVAADEHRSGANGLIVAWTHDDLPPGLGPGNGSGVAKVQVLLLDGDGELVRDLGEHDGRVTSTTALGVFSGDLLHFITVATDEVGHRESPCLPLEPAPCYRAKMATAGVQQVLLDYGRPALSDLAISRVQVPPEGQATFSVRASDAESGLATLDLRFDHGFPDAPLLPVGNGVYRAVVQAFPRVPGEAPAERPFVFTAAAVDFAGNERLRSGVGVLDDRPPRLAPQPLDYGAEDATAAQSPSLVRATVRVQDAAVAWVKLNASSVLGDDEPLDCILDAAANLWTCELVVPEGTPDGQYDLAWESRDAAGNENRSAMSRLTVSDSRPRLAAIEVHRTFHDGFAIRWTSDVPGTARLQYGRDDRTESVAVNATCAAAPDACDPYRHDVEVRGLPSAQDFFVRAVTVGRSGLANATQPMVVRTGNSFTLAAPGLEAGDALRAMVRLPVEVASLDGSAAPVAVSFLLQDEAGRASPLEVHQQTLGPGSTLVEFDSRQAPDGRYQLILAGLRSGERNTAMSPLIRVDNTEPVLAPIEPRPGSRVATAKPLLVLSVADAAGTAPLALGDLNVTVDGERVGATARAVSAWRAGAPQRIEVALDEALAQGSRQLVVSLEDAAGNPGQASWPIVVDTAGPSLRSAHVAYPPGQQAVAPGGTVRLLANLTDPAGVTSAVVDGAAPPVVFLEGGSGTWTAQLAVPTARADGDWLVPVRATDRLGTAALVSIPVTVDARLPGLVVATAEAASHTSLRLRIESDEAVALRATSGSAVAGAALRAREHQVVLEGLAPGQLHAVTLELTDRAGNRASFQVNGTTPHDDEAPAPVVVNATSPQEGVVELAWTPARDNAAIRAYRVERRDAAWVLLAELGANRTAFQDVQVPLGSLAQYRVTAIDVAGLASPPVEALVRVLALPHLEAADMHPRVARADQAVTFSVLYRHGGGRLPDQAFVEYLDLVIPLAVTDAGADCATGCTLEGAAHLPPAALGGPAPEPRFVVAVDGHSATLTLGEGPRILAHDQALRPEGASVPGPSLVTILAAFAVAAFGPLRRKRT